MIDRIMEGAADATNVVELPFVQAKVMIAEMRRGCETLRQSITDMQRCIESLEETIAGMSDWSTRKELQRNLVHLNALLLERLEQLSGADQLLQDALGKISSVKSKSPKASGIATAKERRFVRRQEPATVGNVVVSHAESSRAIGPAGCGGSSG